VTRRQHTLLLLLVVAAIAARLVYAYWVHAPGQTVVSDMGAYHQQARHLLAGTLGPSDTFFPMGYPALIAAAYHLSPAGLRVMAAVQACAGGLTCLLAFLVARRFDLTFKGGLAAAATVAVYPPFIFYGSLLLTESISPLLVTLTIYLLLRTIETPRWWWAAALGLTFATASVVRTNILPFAPVIALCLVIGVGGWRRATAPASVALVAALPLLLVTSSLNSSLVGRWSGPSTNGGLNFFMMQAEVAQIQYYDSPIRPIRNVLKYKGVFEAPTPFYDEPYFYREGLRLVRAAPWRAVMRAVDGLRETAGLGQQTFWPPLDWRMPPGWRRDGYLALRTALDFTARAFLLLLLPPVLVIARLAVRRTLFEPRNVAWLATAGAVAVMLLTSVLFLADPRMHVPYDPLLLVATVAAGRLAFRLVTSPTTMGPYADPHCPGR
jgi:4-amino-4-deoxy-L-arabinose transferase-like glycosyltransferase